MERVPSALILEFQSTLSMRRATASCRPAARPWDISIHALHEESDLPLSLSVVMSMISIHALHEESDLTARPTTTTEDFNPRSP